jgi:hypothetical protein
LRAPGRGEPSVPLDVADDAPPRPELLVGVGVDIRPGGVEVPALGGAAALEHRHDTAESPALVVHGGVV